ncbi:MAG: hypothetical protein QXV93_01660 [Zestosphaera sp.]
MGVKMGIKKWYVYMLFAAASFILSVIFMLWSVYYMSNAMVGTSFLTALAGFAFLASSIQALKITAYVYSVESGATTDERKES